MIKQVQNTQMEIAQAYKQWIQTAIRPSPDDCILSAPECLLKGKSCTLRHVSIISEQEYFQRSLFGELVASVQKFKAKYPLEEVQYQQAKAFGSAKVKKQYQKEKKIRDFNQHLIVDHALQSYDVPCDEFLSENCKLLGYVQKQQNTHFLTKCKKIRKFCKIKKDHSFMDEKLGFGKYHTKTWRQVDKYYPSYLDWGAKQFKNDFLKRQKALIMISKRKSSEERREEIQQMKKDLSFMKMETGIRRFKDKTWAELEQEDQKYIDWVAYYYRGKDQGDFATIIQKNRNQVKEQVGSQ